MPNDESSIDTLLILIQETLEALEGAEGYPLPWPTQKIVREHVARAFEEGRHSAILLPRTNGAAKPNNDDGDGGEAA